MAGRIGFDFEVALGRKRERSRPDEEAAMRILLMGDFSGRSSRGVEAHHDLATRKPLPIDIDKFDRVMGRIAPRFELAAGAGSPSRWNLRRWKTSTRTSFIGGFRFSIGCASSVTVCGTPRPSPPPRPSSACVAGIARCADRESGCTSHRARRAASGALRGSARCGDRR